MEQRLQGQGRSGASLNSGRTPRLKRIQRWAMMLTMAGIMAIVYVLLVNAYVGGEGERFIVSPADAPAADAILVLGARVMPNGGVSAMLGDRLKVGLQLYQQNRANRIIVSGDHGQVQYDEVNTMKSYLKARGVPGDHIFMDHAGFSTYESMYRARDIFLVKKDCTAQRRPGLQMKRKKWIERSDPIWRSIHF